MSKWISVKSDELPKFLIKYDDEIDEEPTISEWVLVDWYYYDEVSETSWREVQKAFLSEQLVPDSAENILVWTNNDGYEYDINDANSPTHWMPLPELPETEQK